MDSDIEPPERRGRPFAKETTNNNPNQEISQIDEQKIEQEFGPPPDDEPKARSGMTKLLLLPSFSHKGLKKKHLLIAASISLIFLVVIGCLGILHFYKPTVAQPVAFKKPIIKTQVQPTTVPSTLTGLPVAPSVNQRPVTAVMIENSDAARPQSGLDQAGVVFEALTEGGITRFMALYQDTQPDYIGPVRSVRPYFIQWAMGFDAAIAHVGGSPLALQDMANWNVRDLNQFYNGSYYERIPSRYAPHNVYTSIAQLNQLEDSKGYTTSVYTGFPRKVAAPSKTPNATSINFTFSSSDFNVQYDYNPTTNSYPRSEGGAPHMELNLNGSQVQIAPKVVIAMIVPYSLGPLDTSDAYYSVYQVIGSGPVDVFQDGTITTGTWTKTSNTSQIVFKTDSGQPLLLDPGQTWISVLASTQDVSYN